MSLPSTIWISRQRLINWKFQVFSNLYGQTRNWSHSLQNFRGFSFSRFVIRIIYNYNPFVRLSKMSKLSISKNDERTSKWNELQIHADRVNTMNECPTEILPLWKKSFDLKCTGRLRYNGRLVVFCSEVLVVSIYQGFPRGQSEYNEWMSDGNTTSMKEITWSEMHRPTSIQWAAYCILIKGSSPICSHTSDRTRILQNIITARATLVLFWNLNFHLSADDRSTTEFRTIIIQVVKFSHCLNKLLPPKKANLIHNLRSNYVSYEIPLIRN